MRFAVATRLFEDVCGCEVEYDPVAARENDEPNDTRALQAYLGRSNIQHTVRYTELSPTAQNSVPSLMT